MRYARLSCLSNRRQYLINCFVLKNHNYDTQNVNSISFTDNRFSPLFIDKSNICGYFTFTQVSFKILVLCYCAIMSLSEC